MGRYTAYDEEWIDTEIQNHLDIAVDELKKIDGVKSIILTGGFGRGEGSITIKNEKVVPVNDYDIYVIVNKRIDEEILNKTAKKIEKRVGTTGYSLYEHSPKSFYFDIRPLNIDKLRILPPMIKYYELKYTSYVLHGEDIRSQMPDYAKEDLPLSDGLRFLFNRMSHITEWFSTKYLENGVVEKWEKETLIYDISKTYAECCTALALLSGCYQPTYLGRLGELKKVFKTEFYDLNKNYPNLLEKIEYFTYLKLKPDYDEIVDIKGTWFEARRDVLGVTEYFLKQFIDMENWDDFFPKVCTPYVMPYIKSSLKNKIGFDLPNFLILITSLLAQIYLTVIWFRRVWTFKNKIYLKILLDFRDPGLRIFSAVPFIMMSIEENDKLNMQSLVKGIELLKKAYPFEIEIKDDFKTYDEVRKIYADAWKLYYFQKLI